MAKPRSGKTPEELLDEIEHALDGSKGHSKGSRANAEQSVRTAREAGQMSGRIMHSVASRLVNALRRLERVANGAPEVMVKITNKGVGKAKVLAHLDYITRNGKLELETRDADSCLGKSEVHAMLEAWDIREVSRSLAPQDADTVHVMFSMPKGTDAQLLKDAVREALSVIFPNHPYAFVLHDDGHDAKTVNPHCHVVVRKSGLVRSNGSRARLRHGPFELGNWRREFARLLQQRGIRAEATRRYSRGRFAKGLRQPIVEMQRRRGETPLVLLGRELVPKARTIKARSRATAMGKFVEIQEEMVDLAEAVRVNVPNAGPLAAKIRYDALQSLTKIGSRRRPSLRGGRAQMDLFDRMQGPIK